MLKYYRLRLLSGLRLIRKIHSPINYSITSNYSYFWRWDFKHITVNVKGAMHLRDYKRSQSKEKCIGILDFSIKNELIHVPNLI